MYLLTNETDKKIECIGGPVIEAHEVKTISRAKAVSLAKEAYNFRLLDDRKLTISRAEDAPEYTAEFIAGAKKSELLAAVENTHSAYGMGDVPAGWYDLKIADLRESAMALLNEVDGLNGV